MPNYEEVIQQSQVNVKSLSEKLRELDELHDDLKQLIRQPEIFDVKYQQIVKLTEDYTNTLGAAAKKYLDGSNSLFTAKLIELADRTKDLQREVARLVEIDYIKLFSDLQSSFIEQTRKDLATELKKFDQRSIELGRIIEQLRGEVERLKEIDLDKHFEKLQKTLSDIFSAVNSINLNLAATTQTLNEIVRSIGTSHNLMETHHVQMKQTISSVSEVISSHLNDQDETAKRTIELFESRITNLSNQTDLLKREFKTHRTIQIIGVVITILLLIYIAIKHK